MDHIIKTNDGFDCIVNGKRFGTWRSRAEATAGMATEQRRATVLHEDPTDLIDPTEIMNTEEYLAHVRRQPE